MLKAITTYVLCVLINNYISLRYSVLRLRKFQIFDSRRFRIIDLKQIICNYNLTLCKIATFKRFYCFIKSNCILNLFYTQLSIAYQGLKANAILRIDNSSVSKILVV